MFHIRREPGWALPERKATLEAAYLNRRAFLRRMGWLSAGALALPTTGCHESRTEGETNSPVDLTGHAAPPASAGLYPAKRNARFNPGWRLTEERVAEHYNNFYEFSLVKDRVASLTGRFVTDPWSIEIGGLVDKPMRLDLDKLLRTTPLEERVYRFRCVEAWAMIVPWTGFPLSRLIERVKPRPEAKFVRFICFNRPDQAPGMKDKSFPWPYFEGLRMDEAMHPLTLLVSGIYGKPLPKQNGAPIRVIVPWKYGYKGPKSIVRIEFVAQQPKTFWETLAPDEYPFLSNVDPKVPHPRWSQATERMIDTGDRVRTLPYNGYGDWVAKLYSRG